MSGQPAKTDALERYGGLPVTVMGLGRFGGGVAAARFLASHGARVSLTDQKAAAELEDSLAAIADLHFERQEFGGHSADLLEDCQLLVVNPAVKPDHPLVGMARARGVDVTTEIELFLRHNPARVIAVTGSNGKSTTTALIHHLLSASLEAEKSPHRIWLGGNIGVSLLPELPNIDVQDTVVLEVSSFQLEQLRRARFRPHIAVLTNFSPNHLDWHGSIDAYRCAKQGLFDAQRTDDAAIVPVCGTDGSEWRTRGRRFVFGLRDSGGDGAFIEDGELILRRDHETVEEVVRLNVPRQLPGDHNRLNVAAAACAAWLAGADAGSFRAALSSFSPLPHRLQKVAEHAGRQFWNDSIATTPESAIAGLQGFDQPVVLLAGGYDKGQDLTEFAAAIAIHTTAVVLMGQTSAALRGLIQSHACSGELVVEQAADFPDAFRRAVALSRPGDIVLLSPGCASYGWFRDYRERGELFTRMAQEWRP
jgi:UDP-N-acetylmuramoylalanine--D-glutamate ligase